MSPVASAAAGGLAATLPMTIAMALMHRTLPAGDRYPLPPHLITMRVARAAGVPVREKLGRRERHALTLASHYGYGAAAGSLFGLLAPRDRGSAALAGVGYGLIVWSASYLGLLPALGILTPATKHPPRRNALMIAAHVVWGAGLGLLVTVLRGGGRLPALRTRG